MFDMEDHKWVKTRVIMNGKVVESDALYGGTLDSDDSDIPKVKTIGSRMGHCISTVFQQTSDRYSMTNHYSSSNRSGLTSKMPKDKLRRGMWIHERTFSKEETSKGREFKEGFYMFGG